MNRTTPIFYGWYVVFTCLIGMVLVYGVRHSFSVFFTPILSEFGWSRGNVAMMLSLNILIYGFIAPVAGFFSDRWRPRVTMPVGVLILALATAGCAFASELRHFYIFFGLLMPLGTALCGWPIYAPALMNWFHKKRGSVLGFAQMGGGLSMAYTVLVRLAIEKVGWRDSFLILAGILIAVFLPLVFFFFYYHPREKGLIPYGLEAPAIPAQTSRKEGTESGGTSDEQTLPQVLRSPRLWLLVLSYALCWGVANYMILAHQVRFLEDAGFSSLHSSSTLALFGIMVCTGQATGFVSDWIGREKAMTAATSASLMGITALLLIRDASQPWLLYVFGVCCGYGAGLATPTTFAASADIFHGRHFGTVGGFLLAGMGMGGILGPWFGGFLHDLSGNYTCAFILCMACVVASCLLLWIAAPRRLSHKGRPFP
jgi:sugar phosphate permease